MIYGPIDLSQVNDGLMSLNAWSDIEYDYDFMGWGVSTDHLNYFGKTYTGYSNGWISSTIDLKNVYTLGNVMGKPQVWIGIWFTSDAADVTYEEGAAVDNIVLATCQQVGGCVGSPALSTAAAIPETLRVQDASRSLPQPVKDATTSHAP